MRSNIAQSKWELPQKPTQNTPRESSDYWRPDFIRLANSDFLNFVVDYFCERQSEVSDLLVAYAATELYSRWMKLEHQNYAKAFAAHKTDTFTFVVPGAKQVQLQFLDPIPRNRMKGHKPPGVPEE